MTDNEGRHSAWPICDRLECVLCYYCERYVSRRHEHDHFPVPQVLGGTEMVTACFDCHELKDRTPFAKWPTDLAGNGMIEIVSGLPDDVTHRIIEGDHRAVVDAIGDHREVWSRWSAAGRLFYAKCIHIASGFEAVGRKRAARPEVS